MRIVSGYNIIVKTYTYSTVQSPSWEATWFEASQEIPRISRNPKVHYRTHKRPPLVPIVGQPNPVHIPTSHLLEIHPNIIHPSTPRSPQWSLSLRFPHQDPICPPLLTHTRHMPRPLVKIYIILKFNTPLLRVFRNMLTGVLKVVLIFSLRKIGNTSCSVFWAPNFYWFHEKVAYCFKYRDLVGVSRGLKSTPFKCSLLSFKEIPKRAV